MSFILITSQIPEVNVIKLKQAPRQTAGLKHTYRKAFVGQNDKEVKAASQWNEPKVIWNAFKIKA